MKRQPPTVTCIYKEEGESPHQIICRSFSLFLQRELERAQPGAASQTP